MAADLLSKAKRYHDRRNARAEQDNTDDLRAMISEEGIPAGLLFGERDSMRSKRRNSPSTVPKMR
jgi:hypothetical protein